MNPRAAVAAEFAGSALLLAVVVGSGIMGERLAAGNAAVALLGNSMATGAGLYVLITLLGPVSGAHFNPAVTLMFWRSGAIPAALAARFIPAQILGGMTGVWLVHAMFALPLLQVSLKSRAGPAQWLSECLATVLLLLTIRLGLRHAPERLPLLVALVVVAGYWFTSSTFFANPAVTVARALSDSFAGIRPSDVPGFLGAQLLALALLCLAIRLPSVLARPAASR